MKKILFTFAGLFLLAGTTSLAKAATCTGGHLCDGSVVTGNSGDAPVCGFDLRLYECTEDGWQTNSTPCSCGDSPTFCQGGIRCDGTPVTGRTNEPPVCGLDLQLYLCTSDGWLPTSAPCTCGPVVPAWVARNFFLQNVTTAPADVVLTVVSSTAPAVNHYSSPAATSQWHDILVPNSGTYIVKMQAETISPTGSTTTIHCEATLPEINPYTFGAFAVDIAYDAIPATRVFCNVRSLQ